LAPSATGAEHVSILPATGHAPERKESLGCIPMLRYTKLPSVPIDGRRHKVRCADQAVRPPPLFHVKHAPVTQRRIRLLRRVGDVHLRGARN
jgi:hypothetical protein